MTIRLIEIPAFAESDGEIKTLNYTLVGTTSENTARSTFLAATPGVILTAIGTLYREPPSIRQTAYDSFAIQVTYTRRKAETGEWTWDFDTTGGTVHISHAKESIARYYSGGSETGAAAATNVPKHNQAIGVDRTGNVQGTDIVIPAMKINVSYRHPLGQVTIAFAKKMHNMTGKVNSTKFLNFAAGEVLFLGARGSDGTVAEGTVGYSFAMSQNVTGLTIGEVAGVAKKGWEYLWISYKEAVSAGNKSTQPEFVYVERVYDTADFAAELGFGG